MRLLHAFKFFQQTIRKSPKKINLKPEFFSLSHISTNKSLSNLSLKIASLGPKVIEQQVECLLCMNPTQV